VTLKIDRGDVTILLECSALVNGDVDTLLTIGVSLPELWKVLGSGATVDNV